VKAVILSWLKKNAVAILLKVSGELVAFILNLVSRARKQKETDFSKKVRVVKLRNELSHLYVKKEALDKKKDAKVESIKDVEDKIQEVEREEKKAKLELEGLDNEEVARRLSSLGF
jgi:hypothetical protein